MNSFDVFDTLIARRYIDNTMVLNTIATELKIPNFTQERQKADNGARSLTQIYETLVINNTLTNDAASIAMAREIELERQTSIPIKENMDKVSDGDLLISDMYLPAWAILEMTKFAGLKKQVTIHQSNAGKSSGKVWKELSTKPDLHLGDNAHSDVTMPTMHGISAVLYPGTAFNEAENFFYRNGMQHVALLIRESRLRNYDADTSPFFTVANSLNLAWLFVTAEMLYRKYKNTDIVFLGRDCQLLQKIYATYYNSSCSYLPFSRKVAFNQPDIATRYLKKHSPEKCVYFDLVSTGETWRHLATYDESINITVALYSDSQYYSKTKPILPSGFDYLTKFSDVGPSGLLLEVMNCADHGSIVLLNEVAPDIFVSTFGKHELTDNIIDAIHLPIETAVELDFYKNSIRNEMKEITNSALHEFFKILTQSICGQTILNNYLHDFHKQESTYLQDIKENML